MRGGWVILHIWNSCQVPGFFQSHDPFDVSRSQLAFCLQFLHKVKDQLITLHSICVTPGGVEKTFLLPKNSRFWREWLSACLSLSYQSSLIFLTLPPLSLIPPPSLFLSHSSSLTTSTSPFLTRPSSLIPQHSSFLTLPSHLISHPSSFTPPYALLLLYPLSFTPPSPLISLPWPLLLPHPLSLIPHSKSNVCVFCQLNSCYGENHIPSFVRIWKNSWRLCEYVQKCFTN